MMYEFHLTGAQHTMITADLAVLLTHTSQAEAYDQMEHQDFTCPVAACTWGADSGRLVTAASKETFRKQLENLAGAGKHNIVKRKLKDFADAHHGFDFETPCMFKFVMVCPDPLHAYINVVSAILSFAVRDRILIDPRSEDPSMKELKAQVCEVINTACSTYRIGIQFSTSAQ
eukprot:5848113-Pleurochrysis_carterae.AAC.1